METNPAYLIRPKKAQPSTGKERDEETGYSYFSARYLDNELLTSFISVDRYADKYPFISPYAYCAWNSIKLTDPTGDTIINMYLQYKNCSGTKGDLYRRTQQLIDNFRTEHPEEFEILNNLSFVDPYDKSNNPPVNIVVGVSDENGPRRNGTVVNAETMITFIPGTLVYTDESGHLREEITPCGILNNKITTILYKNHHDIGTLANEFGDAIFATSRPETSFSERKMTYNLKSSTQFSYDYENYITGKSKTRPDPFDTIEYP